MTWPHPQDSHRQLSSEALDYRRMAACTNSKECTRKIAVAVTQNMGANRPRPHSRLQQAGGTCELTVISAAAA